MKLPTLLAYFFGAIMAVGALGHVLAPDYYAPMVPAPIPLGLANVVSVVAEAATAVLLFRPAWRRWGFVAFTALMVAFLPIHVWDLFRDEHFVGSFPAAVVRLLVQFVFIGLGAGLARRAAEGPVAA
ncbi:MAG: hypothetical protein AAF447_23605 [Myxococcota bacterium]